MPLHCEALPGPYWRGHLSPTSGKDWHHAFLHWTLVYLTDGGCIFSNPPHQTCTNLQFHVRPDKGYYTFHLFWLETLKYVPILANIFKIFILGKNVHSLFFEEFIDKFSATIFSHGSVSRSVVSDKKWHRKLLIIVRFVLRKMLVGSRDMPDIYLQSF